MPMLNNIRKYGKVNVLTSFALISVIVFTLIFSQLPTSVYSEGSRERNDNDVEVAYYPNVRDVVWLNHIIIGTNGLTQEEENSIRAMRDLGEDERVLDVIDVASMMKYILGLTITPEETERVYVIYEVLFQNRETLGEITD